MSDDQIIAVDLTTLKAGGKNIFEIGGRVREIHDSLPASSTFVAAGEKPDDYTAKLVTVYDQTKELGDNVLGMLRDVLEAHGSGTGDAADILGNADDEATVIAKSETTGGGKH